MIKTMKSKKNKGVKVVDRKFMEQLADKIYDRKTRKFMKLCSGRLTLTDREGVTFDKKELDAIDVGAMHCGLGELYFEMTGDDPVGLNEDDVVEEFMERAVIEGLKERQRDLNLAKGLKNFSAAALKKINETLKAWDEAHQEIDHDTVRELVENIPNANDDAPGGKSSYDTYRSRAMRVATQMRKIAKFLR